MPPLHGAKAPPRPSVMTPEQLLDLAHKAAHWAISEELARQPDDRFAFDCGFAWVTVRPARGSFINYCRKQREATNDTRYGSRAYEGGWMFWCPGSYTGQSVRVWRAGAVAFAEALQRNGFNAEAASRLD